MKRCVFLLAAVLLLVSLSACGGDSMPSKDKEGLQIVATVFPEYDWVMNVLGANPAGAGVTLLLDDGVDLHSFQPSAADMLTVSACDLFIYVGGTSDAWVADALRQAVNPEMVTVNLLEVLGEAAREEELVEGMEGEEDEEPEYDEHVWLSLRNAAVFTEAIAEKMQSLDKTNADIYQSNAAAYIEKLNALDKAYGEAVEAAAVKTLLFGDRFPFRYLTDDYGLSYYAAFLGCSAESEASFGTVTFLAGVADELGLHAVMTIEGTDHCLAETIVQNTASKDQKILVLDSMQSASAKDVRSGKTYLSVMERNLEVLKEALE